MKNSGSGVRSQRGAALVAVMVLLALGAVIGAALLQVSSYSYRRSRQAPAERQAYYAAMAGVEVALADIQRDPDQYLQPGQRWEPLPGSPAGLAYRSEVSRDGATYLLRSEGGPDGHKVVYTITLVRDADPFLPYTAAIGGGVSLGSSNKAVSLLGAPIYIEGDLIIDQNDRDGYELTDGQRIVVTGEALIGKNQKARPATAADLGASELVTGAPPQDVKGQLAAMVADLEEMLGTDPRVAAYNPDAWGLYEEPAERVVFVEGSLGCDGRGWELKHDRTFYGRLVVTGEICQPSSGSLTIHGALLAGGMNLGAQQDALQVEYDPQWIPRLGRDVTIVDARTED